MAVPAWPALTRRLISAACSPRSISNSGLEKDLNHWVAWYESSERCTPIEYRCPSKAPVITVPSMPPNVRSDCSRAVAAPRLSRETICCEKIVRLAITSPIPSPLKAMQLIQTRWASVPVSRTIERQAIANIAKPR